MVIEIEGSIAAGTQPIAISVMCRSMMAGHETPIPAGNLCPTQLRMAVDVVIWEITIYESIEINDDLVF